MTLKEQKLNWLSIASRASLVVTRARKQQPIGGVELSCVHIRRCLTRRPQSLAGCGSVMRLSSPNRALIVTNPRCRGRLSDNAAPPPAASPSPTAATWTPEQPAAKAAAVLGIADANLCARFDRKKMRRSSGAREALRSLRLSVTRGLRRSPSAGDRTPRLPLPTAEVTAFHPDGTHSVRLRRPADQPFGFNVSRAQAVGERRQVLSISRMSKAAQRWQVAGMLSVGDEIVAVDGVPCVRFTPLQLLSIVGHREDITLRVRPYQCLL